MGLSFLIQETETFAWLTSEIMGYPGVMTVAYTGIAQRVGTKGHLPIKSTLAFTMFR